ncbi:Gfo/Idh/MocA family protein [Fuerstiella marisgermanici]|uniref:Alpha-N-acetylgalactosaminidase n=1 Tax=Fuerstiella marisgermanici TaxID=1891926 RepID=A0A1P8W8T2_9PLAN|nr:Gfo/Idh/MocA family oxidoreductase [Fuerstiella marisgermanici]APZ90462.1 Alpha-N-acetylgalactosaminidase [Fuerstiella marisgermanici]
MAKTWRVGIIGSTARGNYGHGVDVAFTKIPDVTIVAVADHDDAGRVQAQKRVGAANAYSDYRKMLATKQLDIVAICPRWMDQHHDMIMAAAEAGCHIYMEKPFCPTLKECDEAVRALEMRHLKLGIAHVTQYSPVLDTVLSIIKHGEIGEVLELRGRGKEDRRGGGEDLWVLGSHVMGMMRSIAGGNASSCIATVFNKQAPVTKANVVEGAEGIGLLAGDHLRAQYSFPNGVSGYFASKRGAGGSPTRFGLQVMGSRGIIELQSGYLKPAFILQDSSWSPGRTGKTWKTITSAGIDKAEPRTDGTYEGGHIAAIRDLTDSVEGQRDTRCSAEDSRAIVEMIAAVFESHRIGAEVELPLKTRGNPLSLLT